MKKINRLTLLREVFVQFIISYITEIMDSVLKSPISGLVHYELQWRYAYFFYISMIWYGIPILCYFYSMIRDIKKNMIRYVIEWYGIVCCAMLWDLSKYSLFHRRVPFILHFKVWFTGLISL